MITQAVNVDAIPHWDRDRAMAHATAEYDATLSLLRGLDADEWELPTECEPWTVRNMTAHVLGMAEWLASFREFARVQVAGARGPGPWIDNVTATQVADRVNCTPSELMARLARSAPKAVRTRRRLPLPLRRKALTFELSRATSVSFTVGQLHDVILTRDVFMHRIDIARATGRELQLGEREQALIADVVRDWAAAHGQPFRLQLEGLPTGEFVAGDGGEDVGPLPATEFCRILSGRAEGVGLLTTEVPF